MNTYNELTKGTKIYYIGDMANVPGAGEIIKVRLNEWHPVTYDVQLEDGRLFNKIMPQSFTGPGHRFEVLAEREARRDAGVKAFAARYAKG